MTMVGRLGRRAMTEWSGEYGREGSLVPTSIGGKKLPLPEKGVCPSYTRDRMSLGEGSDCRSCSGSVWNGRREPSVIAALLSNAIPFRGVSGATDRATAALNR